MPRSGGSPMALRAGRGGTGAGCQLASARPWVVLEGCLAQPDLPGRPVMAGFDAVGRRLDLHRRTGRARGRVPEPSRSASEAGGPGPGRHTTRSPGTLTVRPRAELYPGLRRGLAFHAPSSLGGMERQALPPFGVTEVVSRWQFAPVVTGFVVLAAGLSLWGVLRVRRRHPARPWPLPRTALFLGGLAVVVIATQSGIGSYDDVLFTDHMIQHLLLIMVAPPLLVVGQP